MRTKEEQVAYEDLKLRLFGDNEYIEADPNDPEIKRFIYLRDLYKSDFTVEELMRDG